MRRGKDVKNKELRESQHGEWLKGVSGRFSNRNGAGRDMQKMAGVNRGSEKENSQAGRCFTQEIVVKGRYRRGMKLVSS